MENIPQHSSTIFDLNLNKILVVDDTIENLQLLKLVFRRSEFQIITAHNGLEGLEKARAEMPFLVLSDIQMPKMDGYTFCRELKSNDPTRLISVIFITSHNSSGKQVTKGLEMGADEYITRPIERRELLARVRAVARLKRAELAAQHEAEQKTRENKELSRINAPVEENVMRRTRELLQEKTKLETILKAMADGVLVLDVNRHVMTANDVAAALLALPSEVAGMSIDDDALNSVWWDNIRRLVDESAQNSEFVQITQPDNTMRSVQIHASPVLMDDELVGWVIVLNDITPIFEVEKMKMRFMTGVTHELKTPLSIIRLHTNNILRYDNRLSPEKRAALLLSIRNQTDLLASLIDDVLTLVRLDAGMKPETGEATDWVEVISREVAKVSPLAADKQIKVNWTPNRETLLVDVPAGKLSLVVGNLIENAIKYTPAGGGDITVTVQKQPNEARPQARFSVKDAGIGIAPADHQRIFDRFFRADTAHTIPGTGLGLAIVKEIVMAHGGDITVKSEAGHGSEFTVLLPLLAVDKSTPNRR